MKINHAGLRKHVSVKLTREDEDHHWGDDFDQPEAREWVKQQLAQGNDWAWCTAKVTVRYLGFESEQYLGSCSYASAANFIADGYYEQMVDDGVSEIADRLESIMNNHDIWEHDENNCLWCVVPGPAD